MFAVFFRAGMCLVCLLAAVTATARAMVMREELRLADCLDLVRSDPKAGYGEALAWLSLGGRPAARHCTALALSALGHHAEAAARLDALAIAPDAGALASRAMYLGLAGNAWMLARQADAAEISLTNALKLRPDDSGLLLDRARSRLLQKKWTTAIRDLNKVLAADKVDVDALRLRAEALLRSGAPDAAAADVRRALVLRPNDVDLLVLRGKIGEAAIRAGK